MFPASVLLCVYITGGVRKMAPDNERGTTGEVIFAYVFTLIFIE